MFVQNQLFYSFGTVANWLIGDPIVTIKVLGPLLMGSVAVMMYLYARRGLGWSGSKSFLVALLLGVYFVSLRNSWDLYAQSFALIFLLATLVVLKSSDSPRRHALAFVFVILTVLGHQLISVILFFVLGLETIRFLIKRSHKDFLFSIVSLGLAGALFLFRTYSPQTGSVVIPTANVATLPSVGFALNMVGLLVYCYVLILPLAAIGFADLKSWVLRFWVVWCLSAFFLLMVFPSMPLYYWNRWVYLLVYPLLFFAVEGLDKLWRFWANNKSAIRRRTPKAIAVAFVVMLVALSGFYLTANPENQIRFFSADNHYLAYIPSSMVQNMLPISDNPSLVECVKWINVNASNGSAVISHYALYDFIKIYGNNVQVIPVREGPSLWVYPQNETTLVDGIVDASRYASAVGNSTVYTVWWICGDGWYKIPALPENFTEIYRSGRMAVYIFD